MIGTYCTLCLVAAVAMLIMIPFAVDELVAMGQFLLHSRRAGRPFWRTFFQGGTMPGSTEGKRPGFGADLPTMGAAMAWGVTVPWTLVASAAVGVVPADLRGRAAARGQRPPGRRAGHHRGRDRDGRGCAPAALRMDAARFVALLGCLITDAARRSSSLSTISRAPRTMTDFARRS
jgi:hypothetical protein